MQENEGWEQGTVFWEAGGQVPTLCPVLLSLSKAQVQEGRETGM